MFEISVFCVAVAVSVGCYYIWDWSNTTLFTCLGEAEITSGEWEFCYTYDLMTIPARIVTFLCGVTAIIIFILTWFWVFDIFFM